ncbi:MAG: hypothetical protein V1872_02790 [bacterium]
MEIYKNDYNKDEDKMMYDLHEIKNKMKTEYTTSDKINNDAKEVIKKYKLNKLKILQRA